MQAIADSGYHCQVANVRKDSARSIELSETNPGGMNLFGVFQWRRAFLE